MLEEENRQEFLINGYVACYFRYIYCGICTVTFRVRGGGGVNVSDAVLICVSITTAK